MDLVLFNMSNHIDWQNGIVNRNFFVARQLINSGKFNKVCLVDFLALQNTKRVFGKLRHLQYAGHLTKQEPLTNWHRLKKVDEISWVFEGLGYISKYQTGINELMSKLKEASFDLDNLAIWSYNAYLPEIFDLDVKLKVFDTVDNWAEHPSYKKDSELLYKNYEQIDQKADIVFTVSEDLVKLYNHATTKWIPNGADIELFKKEVVIPEEMKKFTKPTIGYVGTIQERIDFDLIEKLALDHQDKEIILVGPVWKEVSKRVTYLTENYANIHALGRVSYNELPNYLASMDITIIPHKIDAFLKSMNPMKMYDYLAAGKPIITTPGAGTDIFKDILYIRDDAQSFSEAINLALTEDSDKKRSERFNRVSKHSWKSRVEEMLKFI